MTPGDRIDLGIDEPRRCFDQRWLADFDERPLGTHPLVPGRMVQLLDLVRDRVRILTSRAGRDRRSLVRDRVDLAHLLGLASPRAHAPVGDVQVLAIVRKSHIQGAELARIADVGQVDHVLDLERGPIGLEGEGADLALAPLRPDRPSAILFRPGVFLVDHPSAGRAPLVLFHPVQKAVGVLVVVVRIAVITAVDVVGDSRPPAIAVVGVVISEDVIAIVEVGLQVVPGAGGDNLDLGSVRLAAEGSTADQLRRLAVRASGFIDALYRR